MRQGQLLCQVLPIRVGWIKEIITDRCTVRKPWSTDCSAKVQCCDTFRLHCWLHWQAGFFWFLKPESEPCICCWLVYFSFCLKSQIIFRIKKPHYEIFNFDSLKLVKNYLWKFNFNEFLLVESLVLMLKIST